MLQLKYLQKYIWFHLNCRRNTAQRSGKPTFNGLVRGRRASGGENKPGIATGVSQVEPEITSCLLRRVMSRLLWQRWSHSLRSKKSTFVGGNVLSLCDVTGRRSLSSLWRWKREMWLEFPSALGSLEPDLSGVPCTAPYRAVNLAFMQFLSRWNTFL